MASPPDTDFEDLMDQKAEEHPAFLAFKEKMLRRCYGTSALNDAWAWFSCGWSAAMADVAKKERERKAT